MNWYGLANIMGRGTMWEVFKIFCLFLLIITPSLQAQNSLEEAERVRGRLNQLFYWRLADELKLSPTQEKEMASLLNEVQKNREDAFRNREQILGTLKEKGKTLSAPEAKAKMAEMDKIIKTMAEIDSREHQGLRKILGDELLAKFYVIREETIEKVRSALKRG